MSEEKETKVEATEEVAEEKKEETPVEVKEEVSEEKKEEAPVEEIKKEVKKEEASVEEKKEETPAEEEGADVEVPAKFKDLVETIENMSVIDLNELVKLLEIT